MFPHSPFLLPMFSGVVNWAHLQKLGDKKLAFARRQILQQSPTLIVHLYFSSTLSFCTFLKKVPKMGQLCLAFGASFAQESLCDIFRSVHTSPLAACRNAWGGKNSLRSNIMPPVSKHCSATRCASQRCPPASGGELPLQRRFIDVPYAL